MNRLDLKVKPACNDSNGGLFAFEKTPYICLSCKLQLATKLVETHLGNDAFPYVSTCSKLFASSINSH